MDPIHTNLLYYSNFLDARSLYESEVPQTYNVIWWGFAIVEILLFARLILGYLDVTVTSSLTYVIYTITEYLLYPLTAIFTSTSGADMSSWVTVGAIIGYFLLALALVGFLKATRMSPYSRVERARALSRKKYSR